MKAPRPTVDEIRDEERRVRRVRFIVDFTSHVIMQSRLKRPDAEELVRAARERILQLFPGRDETYELIYAPRFRRLVDEFSRPDEVRQAVLIPFPSVPH